MGNVFHKIFKLVYEFVFTLIFLVVFTVLLPLLVSVIILTVSWRWILTVCVRSVHPDVVEILHSNSPLLAIDDIHGRPLNTIVGMGAFHNSDVKSCMEFVKSSVYGVNPITQQRLHPETEWYYEQWMGYFWWKKEANFDISEHISVWQAEQNKLISEEELIKIVGILESSPFPEKRSPWEVILIPNVLLRDVCMSDTPKTIVMFRFHHGFADGIAMMQLFMRCVFTDSFEKVAKPVYVRRSNVKQFLYALKAAVQLPYNFFQQGIDSLDINEWHKPEQQLSRKIHKAWSSRIPVSTIKEIKHRHNVGFTAVLVSAICGALRLMMIKCNVAVPKKIHAILPLPWPGHPQRLSNHWSYGFMELPVGTKCPKRRLLKIHNYIQNMKKSTVPAVNFVLLQLASLLPNYVIKRVMLANYIPTVILSNFPGPPANSEGIGGFALVDAMFTGGPLRGNIGISITILSYDGGLRIVTGVDSSIFPTQGMTKELMNLIELEFQSMLKLQATTQV